MRLSLATTFCLALLGASPAFAACPTNYLATGCIGFDLNGIDTDLPAAQLGTTSPVQPWTAGEPCPNGGCYDLRTGTSVAAGFGGIQSCFTYPLTTDVFYFIGLPAGAPAPSFSAELWVEGTIEGDG